MGPYKLIHQSLLAYCNRVISDNHLNNFQVFDFDTHSVSQELPEKNLIGISEYQLTNLDRMYEGTVYLGVCTMADDSPLNILRDTVDILFSELVPDYKGIDIINPDSGGVLGNLVVKEGISALPVAKTSTRPVLFIGIPFAVALGPQ